MKPEHYDIVIRVYADYNSFRIGVPLKDYRDNKSKLREFYEWLHWQFTTPTGHRAAHKRYVKRTWTKE